jgi:uridine kinase
MTEINRIADAILTVRPTVPAGRALMVAITGIDGSGKGYVTEQVERRLRAEGVTVAAVNIDGWLELPSRRFDPQRPAEHFYERGIRFGDLFQQLVLPLRAHRTLRLTADLADAIDAETYRRHTYEFRDIDVVLLDGIFLLRRDLRGHFDLSLWIVCTFATALERALRRGQEGLSADETVRAYETIYFPTQRIHFERDAPRDAATAVIANDPRLSAPGL